MKLKEKLKIKRLPEKWQEPVQMLLVFTLCELLFTLLFSLLALTDRGNQTFLEFVWRTAQIMFFWFTAPGFIAAVFCWWFPQITDHRYGYACGFYYGGAGIWAALNWLDLHVPLPVGFLLSALLCYIFYLRNHKDAE